MRAFLRFLPALAAALGAAAQAPQLPYEQMSPSDRALAQDIVARRDFYFESRTEPRRVKLATMEELFDHPRLGAALWRNCQFVPAFNATVRPDGSWTMDDSRGLKGTLHLIYSKPGWRVYLVDGVAEKGRLKAPFTIRARMLTSYHYWVGPKGFESYLQTWTALDSALLGFVAAPFKGYIHQRQDEFIAYINTNIATFGEFAETAPRDFIGPLKRDGDPVALKDFEALFLRK